MTQDHPPEWNLRWDDSLMSEQGASRPYNRPYWEGIIMIQMSETIIDQTPESSSSTAYRVLFTIQQRFQIMNIQLDQATFQKLFVCWDTEKKEVLMAKIFNKTFLVEDSKQTPLRDRKRDLVTYGLRNEVFLLEKLSHQNIPKLRSYCENEQSFCLFMDYFPRGSLQAIISRQGPLPFQDVMPLWRQLIRATSYLHSKGIVHRDISPRNVYVNEKGKLQLLNFRSTYNMEDYSPLQEGLPEKNAFMAPEIFAGQKVTAKIDSWGLGMTLFFMLYGCSPWPHVKETDWHRRLGSTICYPEGDVPGKLRQCIEKMLVYDPEMRIGAKELARLFGG